MASKRIFMVKKKKHQNDPSVGSTPSIWFTFSIRGQLQGSVRVRSMKVSTNQWHNYGSVHLAIFDHLWVLDIVSGLKSVEHTNSEEAERGGGRISEKRKGSKDYFNLVFTYVIFNMRDDFTKTQLWKTTEKINYFGFLLIENL